MPSVTLRVLHGADRGKVYSEVPTPVTIGREEGNTIQLNDERNSRFHIKIQEDQDQVVLTDLESTNGTRVNGEDIQIRILRHGDLITVGRSVLLYGSREEIAARLADIRRKREGGGASGVEDDSGPLEAFDRVASLEFELQADMDPELAGTLSLLEPPELPQRLTPGQAARLTELLEYVHLRLRRLLDSVEVDDRTDHVRLALRQWQNLLDLQGQLAQYLRRIGEPEE